VFMGHSYNHLTLSERDVITTMLAQKRPLGDIAEALGRSKSTISRELMRNSSPEYKLYLSHRAHGRAEVRRNQASRRPRLKNECIVSYVRAGLGQGWSPEQIAGRIGLDHPGLSISHEAIYQYIYHPETVDRPDLIACLRRAHRKRKSRSVGRRERRTKIPNRVSIDSRPPSVENRRRYGHWETDSLVSRKSLVALNSLVERKSRFLMLTRVRRKTAKATRKAVVARLETVDPKIRRTLTMDNGTENAAHEDITAAIGIKCFFTHPYSAWERGTNEHVNGLVRWYLPKGTDFSKISSRQIACIEYLINNRPRKCLGFKKPLELAHPFVALRG
jgi:IS30 family transposase